MADKAIEYINRQGKIKKEIIIKLRNIISHNFPSLKETIMSEGLWYEGKFYITSFKDHVNLGVGISGLSKEESDLFEGKGKTMRHIKFSSIENINGKKILSLLKLVYKKSICDCKINWIKT